MRLQSHKSIFDFYNGADWVNADTSIIAFRRELYSSRFFVSKTTSTGSLKNMKSSACGRLNAINRTRRHTQHTVSIKILASMALSFRRISFSLALRIGPSFVVRSISRRHRISVRVFIAGLVVYRNWLKSNIFVVRFKYCTQVLFTRHDACTRIERRLRTLFHITRNLITFIDNNVCPCTRVRIAGQRTCRHTSNRKHTHTLKLALSKLTKFFNKFRVVISARTEMLFDCEKNAIFSDAELVHGRMCFEASDNVISVN